MGHQRAIDHAVAPREGGRERHVVGGDDHGGSRPCNRSATPARSGIEIRRRLIEQKQPAVRQRARQQQALPLSRGYVGDGVADDGARAHRQAHHIGEQAHLVQQAQDALLIRMRANSETLSAIEPCRMMSPCRMRAIWRWISSTARFGHSMPLRESSPASPAQRRPAG